MSHHELPLNSAKSTSGRLGKIAVFGVALVAVVPMAQAIFIDTNGLSIAATGKLDIENNFVVVRAGSMAAQTTNITNIRGWVNTGYNGGLWDGTGITSANAAADALINGVLGVMMYDNNQLGYTNFGGVVGLDSDPLFNQVMLRMSYFGDYDADGQITSLDYGLLDFYLGAGLIPQGDITADNIVDSLDYGLVDFVLGAQVYGPLGNAVAPSPAGAAPIPEPMSGALMLLGGVCLFGRRRSKK